LSLRAPGDRAGASLEPYEAIVRHAELELELAGRADVAGLTDLAGRWDRLIAGLPSRPPASAAVLIERASLIHERTHVELIRLREALLADLDTSGRAKRAADGYAGQLASHPRLDRSA